MVPGVVAQRVTRLPHPLDEAGVLDGLLTEHEERRLGVVPGEDVEQLPRVRRVRPVVERQCEARLLRSHGLDDTEHGQHRDHRASGEPPGDPAGSAR